MSLLAKSNCNLHVQSVLIKVGSNVKCLLARTNYCYGLGIMLGAKCICNNHLF